MGDREAHLRDAIARLQTEGRVISVSSLYETEPVEFTDQGMVFELRCSPGNYGDSRATDGDHSQH